MEWNHSFLQTSWTWPFLTIVHNSEPRDKTDYLESCFLFSRFYARNEFYNPSIYETVLLKIFFKNLLRHFNHLQGFRPAYIMSGPFRAIPSICNQRSLDDINKNLLLTTSQNYSCNISVFVHSHLSNAVKAFDKKDKNSFFNVIFCLWTTKSLKQKEGTASCISKEGLRSVCQKQFTLSKLELPRKWLFCPSF